MTDWKLERPDRRWQLPEPQRATTWNEADHPRRPNGKFGPKGVPDGALDASTGGATPAQLLDRVTRAGHDTRTEYLAGTDRNGAAIYKAERRDLHDRIRNKFLHGAKPVDDPPRVMFMAGGPASGKSSVMPLLDVPTGAVSMDADAIKGELPEYQEGVRTGRKDAAALAHEESSDLVKDVQHHASERGLNAVVDGVGDGGPGKLAGKMTQWKARGYDVSLNVMTIPTDEAVRRAHKRAERSGRMVPEDVIRESHAGVSQNWEAVRNLDFADVQLWSNDVGPGADPILVARVPKGTTEPVILDQRQYDAFVAKAKEWPPAG
jgi:predicted ABC-type ATPase